MTIAVMPVGFVAQYPPHHQQQTSREEPVVSDDGFAQQLTRAIAKYNKQKANEVLV
jgi:hypothetical protein